MTRRIVFTNKISKDDKSKNSTLPKIQVTRFLVGTSPVNYYRHQSNSGVKLNQSKIMPAITRKPLELHMAKSMGELNDKISEKDGVINSTSPDSLLKSVDSVYKLAEKEYDRGDEEIAFILFMRVTQLLLAVKTKSNCRLDDIKYKKMSQDCIIKSEKLAESLDVRYQMISRSPTTLSSPSSVSSTLPSSSIPSINQSTPGKTFKANNNGFKDEVLIVKKNESNVDQVDCDNVIHPSIEPSDLYNMIMEMKKSKPDDIILLLDARKSQDFASSHISNLKTGQVKLLNIPEERIEKGMAMTRLLKSLPDDDQLALKARRTARKVIIFDWQSKSYSENERLHSLFDALWKWDQTKDRGNSPPILLKLGYYGWVNTYPMHTSNPKVTPPQPEDRKNEANDQIDNSYLNFYSQLKKPVEISTTIDKPKPTVNGVSHSDERDDEGDENSTVQGSNELVMRLTNTKLKDNSTKIPGSAQPVPTINREVKPKLIKNEVTPPTKSVHITKNDKLPSGITTTTETSRDPNNTTNNLASVMESEFKARRLLETAEEMDKLREKELEKLFADKESLLRENVDLKRRLKPNLSKSLDSSTAVSATGVTTSTTTSTSQSSDQGKPVNFRVSQENEEEEEEREDANTKNSVSGDELFVPLRKSNTEVKRSEERTVSESSSTPRPGRSLSRSYSSPNIADHLNEDGSQGSSSSSATNNNNNKTRNSNNHQTPTFDRNLKPLSGPHSADFTRNLSSSVRSRNFSPIYGTLGHVNTGLKNLGNTCFMNAVLQCLADTTEFRRYFLQEKHMVDISRNNRLGSKGELADELGALIREIRSNQYKSVSPSDFKDAVGTHMPFFMGCEQQDAHEFLCMLLEKLHADLNRAPSVSNGVFTLPDDLPPHIAINKFWTHHLSRNQSIVSELFEGLLMSTLECKACGKQSHTFEVFTNLSLPIPTRLGHRSTIADCLDLFSDEEKLYGEAAWECPTCKVKRDASKQIKICKLPKILVIHLKRFSYEGKWRQKLQNMVDFPLVDLKLKNYRSTNAPDNFEATYDLYGVVNHYGTLEGGHYVAYCKNDEKNKWFKYDDHEVTELSTADVKSHAAYLLFYTSNH